MDELRAELNGIFGNKKAELATDGRSQEIAITLSEEEMEETLPAIAQKGFILIALFCTQETDTKKGFTLHYVFERRHQPHTLTIQIPLKNTTAQSIAETFPAACWYEREITDGFGIKFKNAFDIRRLFLHETYPNDFHPLLKTIKNGPITTNTKNNAADEYPFKQVHGEGVYQIPVGPVHAGIIEPGHFRFSVIGETIFNLEIRMFYKHRGIEKLAEGKTPQESVKIAQAISGDETAANTTAYCNAIEKITDTNAPERAWHIRTILLETERIYSHLGDMAGMIIDVAYPAGASPFFILREQTLQQNQKLTGSRFLRDIITTGGLTKNIPDESLTEFSDYLEEFSGKFTEAVNAIRSSTSVIDRLERTGVIKKELIEPLNITGPAARASGAQVDTRIDHPYGLYPKLHLQKRTREEGDVLSRFEVKAAEIHDSSAIIQKLICRIPENKAIHTTLKPADGSALSLIEAPRGQNLHWVRIKDGRIDRYKVRTASFCNWQAIEHAVLGNIVPDFPLINKSLNLSYAGTDL
ncbi:NADH-quinone oxidoreductase subunit C/D [uncultured archaeon]|nr:NADH-quinone oxidoreductase subunit C/D [uncultured archaeon]